MKIAVFQNFPAGGGKRTVYEQVKGLITLGHKITVFQLTGPGTSFCDLEKLDCKIITLHFSKDSPLPGFLARLHGDFKNFVTLNNLHQKIAKKINSDQFDVALIHTDLHTESPYILRYLKIPHVYHCHELLRIGYEKEFAFTEKVSFLKLWYELLTRKYRVYTDCRNASCAQLIITNSKFIKNNIKKAYKRNSVICYSGVDTDVFKPIAKKTNSLLFMGQSNYVGGYEFIQQISKLIPNIQIKTFGFPQGQPDTNNDQLLAKSYSQSLATLCVSYNEPFGLKALESMSCGTPVLAVREGGYVDSIKNGQTGWLLPRDPMIFVKKIKQLLRNKKLSKKIGLDSRKYVLKKWTWKRHVIQLNKILNNLAHG